MHLTQNTNRKITLRAPLQATAQSKLSAAHVRTFQFELHRLMVLIVLGHPQGALANYGAAIDAANAAISAAYTAAMTAAPPVVIPADPRPAAPGALSPFETAAYTRAMATLNTKITADLAAVPTSAPADLEHHEGVEISQADFDQVLLEGLMNLAHSGFPSRSNYSQIISFNVEGLPNAWQPHEMTLNDFVGCLPERTTPYNLGAAYADTIATYIQETEGFETEWGKRHGVPATLRQFGISPWRFITKYRLSDSERKTMEAVSAAALRDASAAEFTDPNDLITNDAANRAFQAERLNRLSRARPWTAVDGMFGVFQDPDAEPDINSRRRSAYFRLQGQRDDDERKDRRR